MACCNHALRAPCLFLTSHPSNRLDRNANHLVAKDLLIFVRWLESRRVPVQELYLTDNNLQTLVELENASQQSASTEQPLVLLPAVRTVILWGTEHNAITGLRAVLAICPQVTATRGKHAEQVEEGIWDILLSFPALQLTHLSLTPWMTSSAIAFQQYAVIESALASLQGLQLLEVPFLPCNDALLATLALNCQQLEELWARMGTASIASICHLMQSCCKLRDFTMQDCCADLSISDVDSIMQAASSHPALPFLCMTFCAEATNTEALFIQAVQNMPAGKLNFLRIGPCTFSKWASRPCLSLCTNRLNNDSLNSLLDLLLCTERNKPPLTQLELTSRDMNHVNEQRIFTTLGHRVIGESSLLDLTFESSHPAKRPIPSLLLRCPKLQYLNLWKLAMNDAALHEIASNCPKLKRLRMAECSNHQITDAGMEDLFAGCPLLEDVHVGDAPTNLTLCTLQAIVQHKLKLKKFTWKASRMPAFGEGGLREFRDLVREVQLLPLPVLTASYPLPTQLVSAVSELRSTGVLTVAEVD